MALKRTLQPSRLMSALKDTAAVDGLKALDSNRPDDISQHLMLHSETGCSPYQNTGLSRYDAISYRGEVMMKTFVFALALLGAAAVGAGAQDAIPDLKGTWTGKGKSIVFGTHAHHPGKQTTASPPRVRDIEATHVVEGQEGRVAWGRSSSAVADTKEPFAWAISSDNKSIVGSDVDGYFRITLMGPDRMEKCYVHNAARPSRSVVATCYMMDRVKK